MMSNNHTKKIENMRKFKRKKSINKKTRHNNLKEYLLLFEMGKFEKICANLKWANLRNFECDSLLAKRCYNKIDY